MTDTPERIWADKSETINATMWRSDAAFGGTEYIRADLSDALVAAAYEAAAKSVEEWQAFTKHAQEPIAKEMADEVRALTPDDAKAALERMREVKVKPLEWVWAGFEQDVDFVDTTQTYQIQEGIFWYGAEVNGTDCGSNDAAKAAAQADYERRIREALE